MKRFFLIAIAFAVTNGISAQKDSLNAVIKVENEYNPVVVKANKQNFTPQIETRRDNKPLDLIFSQESSPYSQFVSERKTNELLPQQESHHPGYARLGYGSNNNIDAMLGYRFDISDNDKIRILASLNGYNTKIKNLNNEKWKSRFYTSWISADYMHRFETMSLGVESNIHKKTFNYQQLEQRGTNKQNNSSYNVTLKAISHLTGPFSYKGNIGYTYNNRAYTNGIKDGLSENHLSANGTIIYELTDKYIYNIGTEIALNSYTYNDALNIDGSDYDNLLSLQINPFTNIRYENWKIRLGAHVDMQSTGGAFLALAPDINIEGQISDKITLFTSATGGRTQNTFNILEQLSPYWDNIGQYKATYKIADIMAGTRLTVEPINASIYAGYAYTKNDLTATYSINNSNLYNPFTQGTSRNIYIGGQLEYDYDGWLKTSTNIRYDKWSSPNNDIVLNYKPVINIDINAEARICKELFANAGYTFTRYTKDNKHRIKNKNNLVAKLQYKFHEQFEAFIQGDNLLCSKYEIYPGYTAQGINFIIGASARF